MLTDFNMFRLTECYLDRCKERDILIPDAYNEVCTAYIGTVSSTMIARIKLNMIMSDVGWALWAAIQAKISTIEFDFRGQAMECWSRAVEKMDSGEFDGWLRDVQS